MVYYGLNQGLLYVFRVFYHYFFTSSFSMEGNRVIGKYGEADHAFIADNFDTVFAGRIMGYEAPRTAPYQSVVELETCAQCIFCRIESATVAFIATGFEYAAEHLLQKVDLVWCEVIEVSSSGNIGL